MGVKPREAIGSSGRKVEFRSCEAFRPIEWSRINKTRCASWYERERKNATPCQSCW